MKVAFVVNDLTKECNGFGVEGEGEGEWISAFSGDGVLVSAGAASGAQSEFYNNSHGHCCLRHAHLYP